MSWKATQSLFAVKDLTKLVDLTPDQHGTLYRQYMTQKQTDGHAITTEVALAVMALSDCFKASAPFDLVLANLRELINASLLHIGRNPAQWKVHGSSMDVGHFQAWMGEGSEHAQTRKIQTLLEIQERPSSRYLVLVGGRRAEAMNEREYSDLCVRAEESFLSRIDAIALANRLMRYRPDGLFEVKPGEATHQR